MSPAGDTHGVLRVNTFYCGIYFLLNFYNLFEYQVFHCVHFECPSQVDDDSEKSPSPKLKDDPMPSTSVSSLLRHGAGNRNYATRRLSTSKSAELLEPVFKIESVRVEETDEDVGIEQDVRSPEDRDSSPEPDNDLMN